MSRYRRLFAALGVAMFVAACGQSGTVTPSASTAASATPAARGAGGDLKILYWQAPTILNPHQATGTKDNDASRLVLEPLASWDKNGKPLANGLAAEIPTVANGEVSKDFKTVTWKLRSGVKWSDGTPFTAADVEFTYTYMCDPKTAATTSDVCEGVDSVKAKDDTTVVVTYKDTQPFFYQWGVGFNSPILQKAQFANCVGAAAKDCPANLKPIGTGPYVVKDFKPGDTVLYDMNPNYRDPKKPFFKSVTFKGGGDAASAARAVCQTGDEDYGWNLQVEAAVLKPMASAADSKCTLLTNYGSSVERLLLNRANPDPSLGDNRSEPTTQHPFFSDIHVRRALAMATDRNAVATQLYGDGLAGKATCNIVTAPPAIDSKNTASMDICKFDLNAANKELDNDGWVKGSDGVRAKNGVKLAITYQTTTNSVRQSTQAIMKQNWEKVGFAVTLRNSSASTFFTNTAPDGANKFFADVEMFTNSGDPDPTSYLNGWTCAQRTGKANNWQNPGYERYCNPDFDKIVASLRTETDENKRNQLAIQANDLLVSDVVIIPLITRVAPTPSGVSKQLKGVDPSPWDSEMYNIADWTK